MKGTTMWKHLARQAGGFLGALILSGALTGVGAGERAADGERAGDRGLTATHRPMRSQRDMVLTVGQAEGDLQGKDDKIIQAGIEYLSRLGGGTLRILPGTYDLRNAIHMRPRVTLQGSGEKTIPRKALSVVTPLVRDADWFEYGVQVKDSSGFKNHLSHKMWASSAGTRTSACQGTMRGV